MSIKPLLSTKIRSKYINFRGINSNTSKVHTNIINNNSKIDDNTDLANQINQNNKTNKTNKKHINKKAAIAILSTIAFTGAVAAFVIKNRNVSKVKKTELFSSADTTKFDVEYRNDLVRGLKEIFGIDKKASDVKSIMGKEELQELTKKLEPNDVVSHEDGYSFWERAVNIFEEKKGGPPKKPSILKDFINNELDEKEIEKYFDPLIQGKCRIFLNAYANPKIDDPQKAALDFLNNAVAYADKVAKKVTDDKPPFTVGITDNWDTIVQQYIVKELSDNPEKYKNLKVVINFQDNMFINPFDKELNQAILKRDTEQIDFLKKELKENLLILPDTYKDYKYGPRVSLYREDKPIMEGARFFNDDDWDEIVNDPNAHFSRDRKKKLKQIVKDKIYNKYILPHYTEDSWRLQRKEHEASVFCSDLISKEPNQEKLELAKIALAQKQTCNMEYHEFEPYSLYSPIVIANILDDDYYHSYWGKCDSQTLRFFDKHGKPTNKLFTKTVKEIEKATLGKQQSRDMGIPQGAIPPIAHKEVLQTLFSEDGKTFRRIRGIFESEYIFGDSVKLPKKIWDKIIGS